MPELPEVETIVRELKPRLTNALIEKIKINWSRTVYDKQETFDQTLTQNRIRDVQRRGKYICFLLEKSGILTIHLRMTGKLLFQIGAKEENHTRVIFYLSDGSVLYFVDTRKFGRMEIWPESEPLLPQLGPEPLEEKIVFSALSSIRSTRPVKTLLLDQQILAGIGNIYADEALFRAGIHPLTPIPIISKARLKKLSHHICDILLTAIQNKGTTISDYRSTQNQEGNHQFFLKVYGREKCPCFSCQTAIERLTIQSRSAHYCPKCQPNPKKNQTPQIKNS